MVSDKERILIAGTFAEKIIALLPFARAFAGSLGANLLVLGLVSVPPTDSLSTGALHAGRLRNALDPRAQVWRAG